MSFAPRSVIGLGCVVGFFIVAATGAEGGRPPIVHPLAGADLAASLKAVAARDRVDVTRRDPVTTHAGADDAVVFWIGTLSGQRKEQWLLQLKRGTATAAERTAHRQRDVTKYLSWGSTVTFHSEVEALDLWIAGPVDMTDGHPTSTLPPSHRTRVFVPSDYLKLGLDNSLRASSFMADRIRAIQQEDPTFQAGHIYALDHPIPAEKLADAKPVGDRLRMPPEMERAWMGGYVALQAFYECTENVGALHGISNVAVEKPSVWKLTKLATGTKFIVNFSSRGARRLNPVPPPLLPVGLETFEFPYGFSFGHDSIVSGAMAVTAPTPPLDVCAGIIALIAVHPNHLDRVVEVIAISDTSTPTAVAAR